MTVDPSHGTAMTVPQVTLSPRTIDGLIADGTATATLAAHMARVLRAYPHFFVLKGPAPTETRALTAHLAQAIAAQTAGQTGARTQTAASRATATPKVSFTRVRIDDDRTADTGPVTRYSRTHQPMPPHTDSSYRPHPHELVAFQMVRADARGGDTLVAAVEDVVTALDPQTRATLEQPRFPFGQGAHPVLWQTGAAPNIRYYRSQIDRARQDADPLAEPELAAMDALDGVLARTDLLFHVRLEAGDTIFLHNTKALHGRTGFAADSDRMMYRIRVRAAGLA